MSYTNSPLATLKKLSPNYSVRKSTDKIDTITIHHTASCCSAADCLALFAKSSRQASSNYVIGNDGTIGLCVEEKNRAWTSGGSLSVNGETGRSNDFHAVTIEVSNDQAGVTSKTWSISDKAMESLIKLCADICKRNGIAKLLWKGDKNLVKHPDQQNMTAHRWFANTLCPGNYLYNRFGNIADRVNSILGVSDNTPDTKVDTDKPVVAKPTIRNGSRGTEAMNLQRDLNYFGANLSVDGIFGPKSVQALKNWQKSNSLSVDGIYGNMSYQKMIKLLQ